MANCCLAALHPLFGALAGSRIEKRPAAANVAQGRLSLGTWQGIFIFEHRRAAHRRSVAVSVMGI